MQIDPILDADVDETQQAVIDTARSYFAAAFPPATVRQLAASETGFPQSFVADWTGMDWHRILVPEDQGGAGLGVRELCLLAREAATAMAPVPFVSAALTTALLARAAPGGDVTAALLAGSERATLSVGEEPDHVLVAGDGSLTGERVAVPYATGSRFVVVTTADRTAPAAHLVPLATGMTRPHIPAFDLTRRWHTLRLDATGAERTDADPAAVTLMIQTAALTVAADSAGVARRALDMAIDHARSREQFGRPIGTYQGVSHRCARMLYDLQAAWTLVWTAAEAIDAGAPESTIDRTTAAAKAYASDAAVSITDASLQVHGGIGFSAEHDSHLLLRRAHTNAQTWRSPRADRATVLRHLLDEAPTPSETSKTGIPV